MRPTTPRPQGPLQALQLIKTVGDGEPFAITPITHPLGTLVTPSDRMAAMVRWAERIGYTVLSRHVPPSFGPYNAVIRVSERGTEDRQRDYLAHLLVDEDA